MNMNNPTKKRLENLIALVKFLFLLIIVVGIPIIVYFNHREIIDNFGSVEKIDAFLSANEKYTVWAFLILQIAQLVICILPGPICI